MDDIPSLIHLYFDLGLKYKDIKRILDTNHEVSISLRHLKRVLEQLNLSRRKDYSDIQEVIDFVYNQLQHSGRMHGYRWMAQKCKEYGIKSKLEDVRVILSILDPEGVNQRKKRRLLRRVYFAKGPNYLWHIDSYDKLKPYGICINGCVDGYSRKILYMNAYHTASDPKLIGGYFLLSVENTGGCPRMIRGDLGTENGYVRDIQIFLRQHDSDEQVESCYLHGPSTANQRIEYMWSFVRRQCTDYWICLFRNLCDEGLFDRGFLDVNLAQFSFMHLIQDDLDETRETWNHHAIRTVRNTRVPSGRPDVLFYTPELENTKDYICHVSQEQVDICKQECRFRESIPCDRDVYDMCTLIMKENGYAVPNSPASAVTLYLELRRQMSNYLI